MNIRDLFQRGRELLGRLFGRKTQAAEPQQDSLDVPEDAPEEQAKRTFPEIPRTRQELEESIANWEWTEKLAGGYKRHTVQPEGIKYAQEQAAKDREELARRFPEERSQDSSFSPPRVEMPSVARERAEPMELSGESVESGSPPEVPPAVSQSLPSLPGLPQTVSDGASPLPQLRDPADASPSGLSIPEDATSPMAAPLELSATPKPAPLPVAESVVRTAMPEADSQQKQLPDVPAPEKAAPVSPEMPEGVEEETDLPGMPAAGTAPQLPSIPDGASDAGLQAEALPLDMAPAAEDGLDFGDLPEASSNSLSAPQVTLPDEAVVSPAQSPDLPEAPGGTVADALAEMPPQQRSTLSQRKQAVRDRAESRGRARDVRLGKPVPPPAGPFVKPREPGGEDNEPEVAGVEDAGEGEGEPEGDPAAVALPGSPRPSAPKRRVPQLAGDGEDSPPTGGPPSIAPDGAGKSSEELNRKLDLVLHAISELHDRMDDLEEKLGEPATWS